VNIFGIGNYILLVHENQMHSFSKRIIKKNEFKLPKSHMGSLYCHPGLQPLWYVQKPFSLSHVSRKQPSQDSSQLLPYVPTLHSEIVSYIKQSYVPVRNNFIIRLEIYKFNTNNFRCMHQ
jgi:hypothetical protein